MVKFYFPFIVIATLTGCSTNIQPVATPMIEVRQEENSILILNHGSGYSLEVPSELYVWGSNKFFSTIAPPSPGEYPIYKPSAPTDYDVHIAGNYSTPCSLATLCTNPNVPNSNSCGCTVAEPQIVEQSENTFTVMGKFAGYPCPVDHCDDTQFGMSQYKGRYVFYSTHEGKTVKIEINQVTDNPQLAEDIFKTFRWTK